jgi:hypothetical protein
VISRDTSESSLENIASTLTGEGVAISNVTYSGVGASIGTFTGGFSVAGLDSGVILSSGGVENIEGPNDLDNSSLTTNSGNDADLSEIVGVEVNDATVLEFDFTVTDEHATVAAFQYVFASEEYNEFANTQYNDVFAFFMSGESFPKANLALIPGTSTPVAINNLNRGEFSEFYVDNDPDGRPQVPPALNIQADGLTRVLTVQANVAPGQTYHLKLAIADLGDTQLDSWVLIKGESLSAACSLIPPPLID